MFNFLENNPNLLYVMIGDFNVRMGELQTFLPETFDDFDMVYRDSWL
jgi:hypothetical protein